MPQVPLEKLDSKPKSSHGGKRSNAGRKPLISRAEVERVKKLIEQHSVETDPKDKKKRARILRLLDTLYEEGVKKRNIAAINNIPTRPYDDSPIKRRDVYRRCTHEFIRIQ